MPAVSESQLKAVEESRLQMIDPKSHRAETEKIRAQILMIEKQILHVQTRSSGIPNLNSTSGMYATKKREILGIFPKSWTPLPSSSFHKNFTFRVVLWLRKPSKKERIDFVILFFIITKLIIGFVSDPIMLGMGAQDSWVTVGH